MPVPFPTDRHVRLALAFLYFAQPLDIFRPRSPQPECQLEVPGREVLLLGGGGGGSSEEKVSPRIINCKEHMNHVVGIYLAMCVPICG